MLRPDKYHLVSCCAITMTPESFPEDNESTLARMGVNHKMTAGGNHPDSLSVPCTKGSFSIY